MLKEIKSPHLMGNKGHPYKCLFKLKYSPMTKTLSKKGGFNGIDKQSEIGRKVICHRSVDAFVKFMIQPNPLTCMKLIKRIIFFLKIQ